MRESRPHGSGRGAVSNDGVLEDRVVNVSDRGTGQGAVISPLLANIYLHYVLDLWAERDPQRS